MDGTLTHAIHDFDAIRQTLGLPEAQPILESIAQLPKDKAAAVSLQLEEMEYDIASRATAQPGAMELLEYLKTQHAQLGIVTRNGKGIAIETLKAAGLNHYFHQQFIISRDCCAPKPQPDGIELLLQRFSGVPESAVMVGDFVFDLQAGKNAGTATVHMDVTGQFPWPELTDVSVSSLSMLQAQLRKSVDSAQPE
ncbi:MAG: HAD family hydrolase [Gammaproteobacteria bacterium]|nr:HAD family hydrolase [Gammaproteobacteria bacterium]